MKYKKQLQVLQNKCIRFFLQLDNIQLPCLASYLSMCGMDNIQHIGTEHFDKINWLPIDERFKQCLSTSVLKFFSEICPQYMNEIYRTTNQNNTVTRNSSLKLFQPLRTKALSQKCLSYLGPFIWNGLPDDVKLSNNVHPFKKTFLTLLREKNKDVYVHYG